MSAKKIYIILLFCFFYGNATAVQVGGINMPDTLKAGNKTLVLNGSGVRTKYFFDVYVAGLYLEKKSSNPRHIIDSNSSSAIRLHIISSLITGDKMADATMDGFKKSTRGKVAPIKGKIDQIISVFQKGIRKYDVYDIIYLPSVGVRIYRNKSLALTVAGYDIKKALFGIWLCNRRDMRGLRSKLLGL